MWKFSLSIKWIPNIKNVVHKEYWMTWPLAMSFQLGF